MKEMNFNVKINGDEVYVNGALHTFDNTNFSEEKKVLWAIADELGFEPAYLFGDDEW